MPTSDEILFRIIVDRAQLALAVTRFAQYTDSRQSIIRLHCEDGKLALTLGMALALVDCDGSFRGKISIKRRVIHNLTGFERFIDSDKIEICGYPKLLRFDRFSVTCNSMRGVKQADLPTGTVDPPPPESAPVERIPPPGSAKPTAHDNDPNDELTLISLLRASGGRQPADGTNPLAPVFNAAWSQADQLLKQAAEILEPLQISEQDLDQVLARRLDAPPQEEIRELPQEAD